LSPFAHPAHPTHPPPPPPPPLICDTSHVRQILDADPTAFATGAASTTTTGAGGAPAAPVKLSHRQASSAGITFKARVQSTHLFRITLGPFLAEQPTEADKRLHGTTVANLAELHGQAQRVIIMPTTLLPKAIQESADKGGASSLIAAGGGGGSGGGWLTSVIGGLKTVVDKVGAHRDVSNPGDKADAVVFLSSRAKQQALLTGREVITFQGFQLSARPSHVAPPAAYDRGWYDRVEGMASVHWRDMGREAVLTTYHWSPSRWQEAELRAKGLGDGPLHRKIMQTAYLATFFTMRTGVFFTVDGVTRGFQPHCAAEAFTKPLPWPAATADKLDGVLQPTVVRVEEGDALEQVQALQTAGRNPAVITFTDAAAIGGKYADGEVDADADLVVRTNWSWCVNKAISAGVGVDKAIPEASIVEAIPPYGAVYCENVLVLRDAASTGACQHSPEHIHARRPPPPPLSALCRLRLPVGAVLHVHHRDRGNAHARHRRVRRRHDQRGDGGSGPPRRDRAVPGRGERAR